jgi:hypothetical protein
LGTGRGGTNGIAADADKRMPASVQAGGGGL